MKRVFVLAVLVAAGCGGGPRQDADEPSGTFKVEVVDASFPARQHVAESVELKLRVRNADTRDLTNVAVTVETRGPAGAAPAAFGQGSRPNSELADSERPVWVLARGPKGGDTSYVNTWTAGPLRAGESRELTWRLVAAEPGAYTIGYRVFPGLTGKARSAVRGHAAG